MKMKLDESDIAANSDERAGAMTPIQPRRAVAVDDLPRAAMLTLK